MHHMKSAHEGKKAYQCSICSTQFTSKQHMAVHIYFIHEGKKPFKCDICNKDFAEKSTMTNHVRTVHKERKINVQFAISFSQNLGTGGNISNQFMTNKGPLSV
jgi:uncharacterized Zn-finger protein